MRAGEVWGLRRMDVDPLRGVIHIRQTVKRDTAAPDAPPETVDMYGREVGPPKNGKPRTISVGKLTGEMLASHLTTPGPGGVGPEAAVFHTKEGCAVRHGVFMGKVFRRALKELPADKRKLRFHDLRHSCASLWRPKARQCSTSRNVSATPASPRPSTSTGTCSPPSRRASLMRWTICTRVQLRVQATSQHSYAAQTQAKLPLGIPPYKGARLDD
jgi:hypothetical protein